MWYEMCRRAEKGSEWWNEEVGRAVAKKRRAFEEWLQRRDRVIYDRYRAQRVAVKWQSKLQKEWRTGDVESNQGMILRETKKMFWKEVKLVRKGEQAREEIVKDVNGQILCDGIEVRRR